MIEQARGYLREDKRVDAALVLERLATELGLDELQERAIEALGRTRRVENELLEGTITRSEAEATRNTLIKCLHRLIHDASQAADRRSLMRSAPAPRRSDPAGDPDRTASAMVTCRGVVKRYGPRFTLGPVSFTLAHGEILAVVGANSSGKTSLLRIVAGELAAAAGTCAVSSRDAGARPLPVPVMLVPESPPAWSGRLEQHLSWQAAIFGARTPSDNARCVKDVLEQLDIAEHRHKTWAELSDGIRMRSAIAATRLGNPGLLLLDEPLGPLDPRAQQDLLRWMRVFADSARRTSVVISAHQVTEVEAVADQVLSLVSGAECSAIRPGRATRSRGTHFCLNLLPGADRALLWARLSEIGSAVRYVELPSYVLVQATAEAGLTLAGLAKHIEGVGVISIQDLSHSSLRSLLWGAAR